VVLSSFLLHSKLRLSAGILSLFLATCSPSVAQLPVADTLTISFARLGALDSRVRIDSVIDRREGDGRLDLGLKKRIRKGFGAELAAFLGAEESHLNVRFGNLLFLRRNAWLYLPVGGEKYYAIGSNYFPEFGMGYTISF